MQALLRSLPLILIAAVPALAEDAPCRQDKAVYAGSDGYALAFRPVGSDAAAVSHAFEISRGEIRFTGYVMDSDQPLRSIAHVEKDCPDGDVTGEDLAACTAYEGYVYGVSATGGVANVPQAGDEAAANLLLAGFGPSLAAAPMAEKLRLQPPAADLFTFRECAP